MKKLAVILVLVFAFVLVGCGGDKPAEKPVEKDGKVTSPTDKPTDDPVIEDAATGATVESAVAAMNNMFAYMKKGDYGIMYDMLPKVSRDKLDNWFAGIITEEAWKAEKELAQLKTAREFLIYLMAKGSEGEEPDLPSQEELDEVAKSCKVEGNVATFSDSDGEEQSFIFENGAWKLNLEMGESLVTGIITPMDEAIKGEKK